MWTYRRCTRSELKQRFPLSERCFAQFSVNSLGLMHRQLLESVSQLFFPKNSCPKKCSVNRNRKLAHWLNDLVMQMNFPFERLHFRLAQSDSKIVIDSPKERQLRLIECFSFSANLSGKWSQLLTYTANVDCLKQSFFIRKFAEIWQQKC